MTLRTAGEIIRVNAIVGFCMKKVLLIVFSVLIFALMFSFLKNYKSSTDNQNKKDLIIQKAKQLYYQEKAKGTDFSNGPCLSNNLMPDWVLDIAHNPRQPLDNLPQNECSAFREGKAHHFIELDPNGNVINIY